MSIFHLHEKLKDETVDNHIFNFNFFNTNFPGNC